MKKLAKIDKYIRQTNRLLALNDFLALLGLNV